MKQSQREVYIALSAEVDFDLCAWCKYYEVWACYNACCKHPLNMIEKSPPIDDCWGFRPSRPVSEIADMVGTILRAGFDLGEPITWYENKGQLIVMGTPNGIQ